MSRRSAAASTRIAIMAASRANGTKFGRPRVHVLMPLQGPDTFEQGLVLGPRDPCAHPLIASKSLATAPAPTCVEQP